MESFQKKLLLTISDDRSGSYNLRFVRDFFDNFCDMEITLFCVTPRRLDWEVDANLMPESSALAEIDAMKRSHCNDYLDTAFEWITRRACDPDKVTKKNAYSQHGTVGEIIKEATDGHYDATVLGRRGLSWFEELVEDSVSHQIMWERIDFPIWICRQPPDLPRTNVLLAIDGNRPSLRIADHVGFMLADQSRHDVTIFLCEGKGVDSEAALAAATEALKVNELPAERIKTKVVKSSDPAGAILKEADRGKYAVVATGRHMGRETGLDRMFPSSVSTQLLRKLKDATLWVSR
jgi:nucleotide-binding universal stress UspA family protein